MDNVCEDLWQGIILVGCYLRLNDGESWVLTHFANKKSRQQSLEDLEWHG